MTCPSAAIHVSLSGSAVSAVLGVGSTTTGSAACRTGYRNHVASDCGSTARGAAPAVFLRDRSGQKTRPMSQTAPAIARTTLPSGVCRKFSNATRRLIQIGGRVKSRLAVRPMIRQMKTMTPIHPGADPIRRSLRHRGCIAAILPEFQCEVIERGIRKCPEYHRFRAHKTSGLARFPYIISPMGCPLCRSEYLVIRHRVGWERFILHFTNKRRYHCMGCGHSFRASERRRLPRPPGDAMLQQDPVCGTYVAVDSSLKRVVNGRVLHFCSPECRDKYSPEKTFRPHC